MSKLSKLLIAIGIIAGVVLAAVILSRQSDKGRGPEAQAAVSESNSPEAAQTSHSRFFTRHELEPPAAIAADGQSTSGSDSATNLISNWEDKVDEILGSPGSETNKVQQLLELFPKVPAAGQTEVARHLSNLLPDQDYGLLRQHLVNPDLPAEVLDVLLGDALNRPNSLKLPALLDVARNDQHPKAAEARDFLQLFLEQDYGTDWDKWQAGLDQWLKDNPD